MNCGDKRTTQRVKTIKGAEQSSGEGTRGGVWEHSDTLRQKKRSVRNKMKSKGRGGGAEKGRRATEKGSTRNSAAERGGALRRGRRGEEVLPRALTREGGGAAGPSPIPARRLILSSI